MTRYAFLIDHDTCIGCHACTVACKAEHDVPLGVNRTWVKYIERGSFPDARRFYSVNRCNHCDDAPCVSICPTTALYRRSDGIVDFDDSSCIGCKSCMNACPYDALFINPDTNTAQKCNFCSHRVEVGLEPSCVIVCPTQSIVAGDLHDPTSRISHMLGRHDTHVRAPEQGTNPHVFYKGADEAALDPLRTSIAADGMIWAETTEHHPTLPVEMPGRHGPTSLAARTAYTTPHPMAWTGKVSAYLVTKGLSAGAMFAAALAVVTGHADERAIVGIALPLLALVFAAVTGALLIADLKQPRRFYFLFTRPQWGSWIVRGAWLLLVHGVVASAWLLGGLLDRPGMLQGLAVPAVLAAAGAAGYTAFLFAQCEGRDLWQSPLVLPALLAQSAAGGASLALLAALAADAPDALTDAFTWMLIGGVAVHAFLLATELAGRSTVHVELALRAMTHGRYRSRFLAGVLLAIVVPLALGVLALALGSPWLTLPAALATIAGLACHEDAFVRAGQSVPLS